MGHRQRPGPAHQDVHQGRRRRFHDRASRGRPICNDRVLIGIRPSFFRSGADDGFHESDRAFHFQLATTPAHSVAAGALSTRFRRRRRTSRLQLRERRGRDKVAFLPFGLLIDKWRWEVFSGQVKPPDYINGVVSVAESGICGVVSLTTRTEAADLRSRREVPIFRQCAAGRYFLAAIYEFQFYKAMCDASGYKGPLNRCTFYGSKAAGDKLKAPCWRRAVATVAKDAAGDDRRRPS